MDISAIERLTYTDRIGTGTYEGWIVVAQYTTDPKAVIVFYVCPIGEMATAVPKDKPPRIANPKNLLDLRDAEGPILAKVIEKYRRIMLIQAPALLRKYDAFRRGQSAED